MKQYLLALLISLLPAVAGAQNNPAAQAARLWRQQHERAIVDEFVTLLSIPNIARDREDIQRNAEAIAAMMAKRGLAPKLVSVPGGNPIVFGEIRTPGATRTIAFYAHYDGQPLDPKEWTSPRFEPTLRDKPTEDGGRVIPLPPARTTFDPEWRLYARGAADDKAPIAALMTAVDAIRAAGMTFKANIKFAFEGEEEAGSANLERTLTANKDLFAADLWLMCDAPLYQTRQQSIIFGARGVTQVDITVYGPRTELHSGHYGNWAPNPAMSLARLLTSMKDDKGRVLVDRFYDDVEPLGPVEKRALAEAPAIDADLMRQFRLGSTDGGPLTLNELITVPSLNIRGMASSRTGAQASNVIPASATVTIDIRMVKGMDGRRAPRAPEGGQGRCRSNRRRWTVERLTRSYMSIPPMSPEMGMGTLRRDAARAPLIPLRPRAPRIRPPPHFTRLVAARETATAEERAHYFYTQSVRLCELNVRGAQTGEYRETREVVFSPEADDVLHFRVGAVRDVREKLTIRYTGYKRFSSDSSIKFDQ